jgi:hypothetical protein
MCAANSATPSSLSALPMVSQEVMTEYILPDEYSHNVVADGYTGVDEHNKAMTWLTQLHLVKPNGRLACDCKVDPAKVWNYVGVQTPVDWRDLLCEESAIYLRQEIFRLENASQPVG